MEKNIPSLFSEAFLPGTNLAFSQLF